MTKAPSCKTHSMDKKSQEWGIENIYKNLIPATKNYDKTDMAVIIISDHISFMEDNVILSIIGEKYYRSSFYFEFKKTILNNIIS